MQSGGGIPGLHPGYGAVGGALAATSHKKTAPEGKPFA